MVKLNNANNWVDYLDNEKIYKNPFIKLVNKYWPPPKGMDLKEYLIEKFIADWSKITNQTFVYRKNNINSVNFWDIKNLHIYTYSFHVIFENENDAILTFFYDPSCYNADDRVYKNLWDIELHINDLASWKWPFTLIVQRWNPKYKPVNNTKFELYKILAA